MKKGSIHTFLILICFLVVGFAGYRLGKSSTLSLDTLQPAITGSSAPKSTDYSLSYPQAITERKNLSLNKERHYRDPFRIMFEDWQDTTYDEIQYKYQGKNYPFYRINLKNTDIYAMMQPGNTVKEHLEFVYEGLLLVDHSILVDELGQEIGFYPKNIYHAQYDITTNKYGIKMKRSFYFEGATCCLGGLRIEFLLGDAYYLFSTPSVAEFKIKSRQWVVTNSQKVDRLINFINTINY